MSDPVKPTFLVNASADPVLVRIEGRASFMNSGSLKDFFGAMIRLGKTRIAVDFQHCASMDSTFLGVLAGVALELRKCTPPGSLTLVRVGERNLELVRNLGLHRLAIVDAGGISLDMGGGGQALTEPMRTEIERTRLVLESHENLLDADPSNLPKFQDLLAFLRSQLNSP
jgi:anti-anti-sigma regulatory factor